jgi:hypothetical protein
VKIQGKEGYLRMKIEGKAEWLRLGREKLIMREKE